jgi:hypothetical protein
MFGRFSPTLPAGDAIDRPTNAAMRHLLRLHPDSRNAAAARIEVGIDRSNSSLVLSYVLTGKMDDIRMPPVTAPARSDDLWRHTCFEAFIGASSGAAYYEFNFSPSTQWAAYRFTSHRSEMRVADEIVAPAIEVRPGSGAYTLQASLELGRLSALPSESVWRLGLSAVIEETGGGQSYWALAHPPGPPDFHHADCFTHELSPARQS